MKIGVAFSLAPLKAETVDGPDDRYEEFDRPETVDAIAAVIRDDGHDVVLLGDGREFLSRMLADPPDFVFNIAEGSGVSRNREARVPAVCEMLGVPYSGSDPLTLAVSLDKHVATQLVCNSVMAPAGRLFHSGCTPEQFIDSLERSPLALPVIVKPAHEGSSKGVRGPCLCSDNAEAANRCLALSKDYQQPILVEEFIEGAEVTVGVIGNGTSTTVIGAMRIVPIDATGPFIYSLEVKRDWRRRVRYEAPAVLEAIEPGILERAARNVYESLGCRDLARIDFRVRDGVPYFIEANPLPGLAPVTSDLVILAEGHGISHSELIRRILHIALRRVGLMERVT